MFCQNCQFKTPKSFSIHFNHISKVIYCRKIVLNIKVKREMKFCKMKIISKSFPRCFIINMFFEIKPLFRES